MCKDISLFDIIPTTRSLFIFTATMSSNSAVTCQLFQGQDGMDKEPNTTSESCKQDIPDSTEIRPLSATSSTVSDKSFQDSLDDLFNSIFSDETDDTEAESIDLPDMSIDEDRLGDPLHSLIVTLEEQQSTQTLSSLMDIPQNSPLIKHPFFDDLRGILLTDCQQATLPSHLFETLGADTGHLATQRQQLEIRFQQLGLSFPEKVKELSNLYEFYSSGIERERMTCLENQTSDMYRRWLNSNFNAQNLQVIERIQTSLQLLEVSTKPISNSTCMTGVRHRPTLSKKGIQLMEHWYESNLHHPYPSATVIEAMALAGSMNVEQVKKWFGNKRNRGGNTRTLTEIARRKHRLRHSSSPQRPHKMIGSLALYI